MSQQEVSFAIKPGGLGMCSENIEMVIYQETDAKGILQNLGIELLNKETGFEVNEENLRKLLLQSNGNQQPCVLPNGKVDYNDYS